MLQMETKHDELRKRLLSLLNEYEFHGNHSFMLLTMEVTNDPDAFPVVHCLMGNDNCGTCASVMLAVASDVVTKGVLDGTLTIHRMPALYADTDTLN